MPLILGSFRDATAALRAVQARSEDQVFMAALDDVTRQAICSGVIQHFAFTYELAWKFMRRQIATEMGSLSVDGVSRRDLFRLAAQQGLIANVDTWFGYHLARNQTSHTYQQALAASVYATSLSFAADAARLLAILELRNV